MKYFVNYVLLIVIIAVGAGMYASVIRAIGSMELSMVTFYADTLFAGTVWFIVTVVTLVYQELSK